MSLHTTSHVWNFGLVITRSPHYSTNSRPRKIDGLTFLIDARTSKGLLVVLEVSLFFKALLSGKVVYCDYYLNHYAKRGIFAVYTALVSFLALLNAYQSIHGQGAYSIIPKHLE